jgi:hypothetical protein
VTPTEREEIRRAARRAAAGAPPISDEVRTRLQKLLLPARRDRTETEGAA